MTDSAAFGSPRFVNTPDYWGYNPLMTAVDGRNISLAKILHAEGSDILALEKNGKGILHICAENGVIFFCRVIIHGRGGS